MKTQPTSQNQTIVVTIQTLRTTAAEFNHVADLLEAREKHLGNVQLGVGAGPRLVRKPMSAAARKKIAKAAKARWANKTVVGTGKTATAKTAA